MAFKILKFSDIMLDNREDFRRSTFDVLDAHYRVHPFDQVRHSQFLAYGVRRHYNGH